MFVCNVFLVCLCQKVHQDPILRFVIFILVYINVLCREITTTPQGVQILELPVLTVTITQILTAFTIMQMILDHSTTTLAQGMLITLLHQVAQMHQHAKRTNLDQTKFV